MKVLAWTRPLPKKLPARVHVYWNKGNQNNWTGELRAVVDDDQLVFRRWSARKGWRYFIEWRWSWDQGHIKLGPMPKEPK